MRKEIWKSIIGFEELYEISDSGRIKRAVNRNILLQEKF
ncbi:MAG: NUMOD4 domain-containing protein [Promethearchaeota archaeon]|jgi:hypothetical protein